MILVVDVGTTSLRVAVVEPDATIRWFRQRQLPPSTPAPGLVEFDASEMAGIVVDLANAAVTEVGEVGSVGITTQRASTVIWDGETGAPLAPGLGWQDLRTVGECIVAKAEHGLALAPNQTATKAAWLLDHTDGARTRHVCVGTVDSWIVWTLTGGTTHVTDHTNAGMTGLYDVEHGSWNGRVCELLGVPVETLGSIVDSSGELGIATALPGAPVIASVAGDQQASLIGQGCVHPGSAKITFGTGGMLDVCTGDGPPSTPARRPHGTFPVVAWSRDGHRTWATEAIMLSAGSNVDWLRDDIGLIASSADSEAVAAQCDDSGGVVFVPALLGLGTPNWDYGARGSLLGVTRGTTRAHVVRSVLEGVAHRGADLVEAAEADTGLSIPSLRIDGGMSRNAVFAQALADATRRPVELAPVVEATTLGAAYLAGLATGVWRDLDHVASSWTPHRVLAPRAPLDRDAWRRAVERAGGWIPELSALDF